MSVEDGGPQPPPPPPASGRGQPNPAPRKEQQGEQQGEKQAAPPSNPTAGGPEKGENAKKRKLNWHSKCLMKAGVEVKFPPQPRF